MAYLQQLAQGANPMGSPPSGTNVGTPPPLPSTEPPPYDVLQDPAWKGLVNPDDHAFRNFLNELSPEHRQMLLQKVMRMKAIKDAPIPPEAGPMVPLGGTPFPRAAPPPGL